MGVEEVVDVLVNIVRRLSSPWNRLDHRRLRMPGNRLNCLRSARARSFVILAGSRLQSLGGLEIEVGKVFICASGTRLYGIIRSTRFPSLV